MILSPKTLTLREDICARRIFAEFRLNVKLDEYLNVFCEEGTFFLRIYHATNTLKSSYFTILNSSLNEKSYCVVYLKKVISKR